ncbi:MAG TPA: PadR family transcriptional regulator [Gemmatimonadales bacterium]|jgi:DNA-binding PadR family transcriptional regulator
MEHRGDSWSDFFAGGFGPKVWGFGGRPGRGRGRRQMFESGDMKFVILRLVKEKPRHGYEIIKALEEQMSGCYVPSAGTVYPTLQLLEDQGYVKVVETEGKKVYHITAEGEAFLEEHKSTLDDILDRVKDAVHGFAGGSMVDLNQAFANLARQTYRKAWRAGPEDEKTRKIVEILKRSVAEIEAV